MTQVFSNNAGSETTAYMSLSSTSLQLLPGDGVIFNALATTGDYELITLHTRDYSAWEIVQSTDLSGDIITVQRGVEGTQLTWDAGTLVTANVTKKTLEDMVASIALAQATATTADDKAELAGATADKALSKTVGTVTLDNEMFSANDQGDTDNFIIANYFISVLGDTGVSSWDRSPTLRTYNKSSETMQYPLPSMGFSINEWNAVQVYRNGLLQIPMHSYRYSSNSVGAGGDADLGRYEIFGHRFIRFWPRLEAYEHIGIVAPRAYWFNPDNIDNAYKDLYASSGVIHSFTFGGYNVDTSSTSNRLTEFSWANHLTYYVLSSYYVDRAGEYGNGAASDSVSNITSFGGGTGSSYASKFTFTTYGMQRLSMGIGTTKGEAFTDSTNAWICAVGTGVADQSIYKYNLTDDTMAIVSATLAGATTEYISAFFADGLGYIFNTYSSTGSSSVVQLQKYTTANDTISAEQGMTSDITNAPCAVYFDSGVSYLWGNSTAFGDQLARFDLATDTISQKLTNLIGRKDINRHDVVCDGKHYATDRENCLLSKDTEVIIIPKTRLNTRTGSYHDRIQRPQGCGTDFWSNC